jgi:DNA-3-methyladenine glycosylase
MESSFKAEFKKALTKEFYLQDTVQVAHKLLGKIISISNISTLNKHNEIINSTTLNEFERSRDEKQYLSGRIVECEAYLSYNDIASHSYKGKTKRNAAMFSDGGIIYVYKIYGIHHCLNIVTENENIGSAVLIRALEPLSGIEQMKKNRGVDDISILCKGPGNLAKAFKLDLKHNFRSLLTPELFIQDCDLLPNENIVDSKRIGVSEKDNLLLRFYIKGNKWVSKNNK